MSTRSRSAPWFGTKGERAEAAGAFEVVVPTGWYRAPRAVFFFEPGEPVHFVPAWTATITLERSASA